MFAIKWAYDEFNQLAASRASAEATTLLQVSCCAIIEILIRVLCEL